MNENRNRILELVNKAEAALPSKLQPDLPPGEYTSGAPEWYEFEHLIWKYGEEIRQLLSGKALRKDIELHRAFLKIACNKNAKRGRQTFINLLGYSCCAQFAPDIASQLTDTHVAGHVIDTINKMRSPDFIKDISPLTNDKTTWVRNKAKQYIKKYENVQQDKTS